MRHGGFLLALAATVLVLADPAAARMDDSGQTLREANQQIARRRYEHAIDTLTPLLQSDPGNPEALLTLGLALDGQGKTDDAIAKWQQAYINLGKMPELSSDESRLLSKIRTKLNTRDRQGARLRYIDTRYMSNMLEFAKTMRRRDVEDLYARVRSFALDVDGGSRVFRSFLQYEQAYYKHKEAQQARTQPPTRGGMLGGHGGRHAGEPAGAGAFARDGAFSMEFSNQAMLRLMTQLFYMPGRDVPIVENGYLRFQHETMMTHYKAQLSDGRQLRLMAIPNAGIVGAGTQAHPNLIRVEGQRAAGADGMARAIGQPLEGVDEVIVQCVDGRYQSFVNGTLVSSRAADGAANITVTLNENSRVLELHLEPAEKIVAVAAPAEGELDQTQIDQMKQDRARATQLLAAGKSLLAQRNHQEAAAKFSEATALDPLCLEAAYLLGEAREGLSQRRGACTAYRGYLVTATMIEEGKLTAPPETEPAQINAERREAARDKLRKLDREGKQLADIIERYIRDLEQLKPKVKSHPYTVERIDERLEQLKGFTLIP